jgi:hypothetical protein
VRNWSTSRRASSCGASGTCARWSGSSIGYKTGTGGSSGVAFLKRALDLTFFPELYTVRTGIGA